MLSIGEFSNICKVSTKTLRYYAEIGLLFPSEINPENGYRYYSIEQLETMLFINRLKDYKFSLEEIKSILFKENSENEVLYLALENKKAEMCQKTQELQELMIQLETDLSILKEGKSIMSYMDEIEIQLVEMSKINILSIRKKVHQYDFDQEFSNSFQYLLQKIKHESLTIVAPPMVLYHNDEFETSGLDTEFAIPIKEAVKGSRDFYSGLCLKTTIVGPYSGLASVYAKQREWAERETYNSNGALYEIYIVDPTDVTNKSELVTEVYYPVKKANSLGGKR